MRGLPILLAGQAMASMDASILVVAAPSLRADLHASGAQLQLVVVMYTLVFAALVVTGARLGDLLGPRRMFVAGLAAFSVASLVGGLAPDPITLIVARGAQGAAGALMTPQVLTLIQRQAVEPEARAKALGAYSLILAVGVAAGQVAGGLLVAADLLDAAWRPALLLNAPVGAALLLAARRGLPPAPRAAAPARRLDRGGAALLAGAMLALVLPLTVGRDAGWPAWTIPALLVAGGAFAAFAAHERRAPSPLFDVTLLRAPAVAAGIVAVLLVMGSYAGFLLCLTLRLQDGLGYSPLQAGLVFAVYAAGFATASLTWSRAPAGLAARLPTLGPLAMAVALVVAGTRAPDPLMLAALLVGGAGHACGFAPLAQRLAGAVTPAQTADLSGLILTGSLIGSVLGTSAAGGIYLSLLGGGGDAAAASAHALHRTTLVLAGALVATALAAHVSARGVSARAEVPVAVDA